jgi:hypothetical protein
MKLLRAIVILASVLLLGLSGCITSVGVERCRLASMNECSCPRCIAQQAKWKNEQIQQKQTQQRLAKDKAAKQQRLVADLMNKFIGHPVSKVIKVQGPATQVADDGAGGKIYVWAAQRQRTVPKRYWEFVTPPKQSTSKSTLFPSITPPPVQKRTTTRGTMRWNSILQQWEFESETGPTYPELRIPDIASDIASILESEQEPVPIPQLRTERETHTYTQRVMLYTRPNGTIYHWLMDPATSDTLLHWIKLD